MALIYETSLITSAMFTQSAGMQHRHTTGSHSTHAYTYCIQHTAIQQ